MLPVRRLALVSNSGLVSNSAPANRMTELVPSMSVFPLNTLGHRMRRQLLGSSCCWFQPDGNPPQPQ